MATTYLNEVLADAPSILVRMDDLAGNFLDYSGNGFDLVQGAGGALTRGVAGAVLNYGAAEFHSADAHIDQRAALDPTTGITQEAWVFLPTGWNVFWGIVSKTIGDQAGTKAQLYVNSLGQVNFTISTTVTNGTAVTQAALSTNTYHHIAATWDGTKIRIYIDGVQQTLTDGTSSYAIGGTITTGAGKFYVGVAGAGTYNPNAGGRIQYAGQYPVAISGARIWQHFVSQNNPDTPNTPVPAAGANGISITSALSWVSAGATSYDLYFGQTNPPPLLVANLAAAAYGPALNAGTVYYWQVNAKAGSINPGSNLGPLWTFQTAAAADPRSGLKHADTAAADGNVDATKIDAAAWNAAHHAPAFYVFGAAEDRTLSWPAFPNGFARWRGDLHYPDVSQNFQYVTQARLQVNVETAGSAGSKVGVVAKPLDILLGADTYPDGLDGCAVLIDSVGYKDSGWINLSNTFISGGTYELTLYGINGNNIAAPVFGLVCWMVR